MPLPTVTPTTATTSTPLVPYPAPTEVVTQVGLQARLTSFAAQLPSASIPLIDSSTLTFTRSAFYKALTSGTFTLDPTGMVPGVEVSIKLEVGTTAPDIPSGGIYENYGGGVYDPNRRLSYTFRVDGEGKIQYVVTPIS